MTTSQDTDKNAYGEKLQARLDQWKAELDRLEAKAREGQADAKIETKKNVDEAQERWQAAKRKADELQKASQDAWKELKQGTDTAFDSLKDAVDRAKSQFS